MVSSSFSTLLPFLLLFVLSTTIAKKKAWEDPVPCRNFYDKGEYKVLIDRHENWRGGTDCWCPAEQKYGSNYYWYHSGKMKPRYFRTGLWYFFSYVQADGPFAQNWFNCDPTALGVENVNLEWAARHCDSIPKESGVSGWGNSYDIEPSKETAPIHVNYAMRCEYPAEVAPNCLCPEKDPPEGGAQICSKRVHHCRAMLVYCHKLRDKEWGKYNYSSPEYCWKLNIIIDRPLGTICSEHAHCAGGLQCSDVWGVCQECCNGECPDKTWSDELRAWGRIFKYGDHGCTP